MFSMNKKLVLAGLLLSTKAFALTGGERTKLIESLVLVESHGASGLIGDGGKAFGILQIHSEMVAEANRIAGTDFTHQDMFNPAKAREVAEIVLRHYDNHILRTTGHDASAKELAFIWNGGGSSWKRVSSPKADTKQRNLERYWYKVSQNLR
jgi:hypothetical protein